MNKLTLQGVQNFALTTDALAFMQSAFESFEQLGFMGGDNIIVSGCIVTGSSVSSGWMFLKGKLLPFSGGSIQTNVRIVETVQNVTVDIASREQRTYHAEFGTSVDPDKNVAWTSIVVPYSLKSIKSMIDSQFGVTTVQLTPNEAGYSLGQYDFAYLIKNNKVVSLYFRFTCNSPANNILSIIPEGYRPPNSIIGVRYFHFDSVGSYRNGGVTLGGVITTEVVHNSGYVQGSATWVIQ